jgi:hypothetical protein
VPEGLPRLSSGLGWSVAQAAAYVLNRLYQNSPRRRIRRDRTLDERDGIIRNLYASGVHPNDIAAQYGITPERVYQIIKLSS